MPAGRAATTAHLGRDDRRHRRAGPWLAVPALLALFLAACAQAQVGSPSEGSRVPVTKGHSTVVPLDEGKPKSGGALAFGVEAEPDGFDPTSSQFSAPSHLIASSMLETLVLFDADRKPQPYLAQSFEPSEEGSRWKITLKPNITFHDGTPLNAEALRANLEAQKRGIGGVGLKVMETISVEDDLTVDIKMTQPWASFAGVMAGQPGYVVAPASIARGDTITAPVGTGPFAFDGWERGTAVKVKKFDRYWQAGKPFLDAITFRVITDPSSRLNALSAGEMDMITTDQAQTIADYRTKAGMKVIVDESGDAQSIFMNQASSPFDNPNARRAVILATDSTLLVDTVGGGTLKTIDQPFAEGTAYHQPDPRYPRHDLEGARKAVQQYTAETGKPLEFALTIFSSVSNLALAQLLQAQWAAAGIKAEINSQEQAAAIKDLLVGKTQAAMSANFGYPEPDFNYIFWHSTYTGPLGQLSINFPHLKLDALDKALDEGRRASDPGQRQEAYKTAVRVLNENTAYVWLYRYVAALVANDRVRGLRQAETTGFATVSFKGWYADLWLDR